MAGFGGFFSDMFGATTDKKAGVPDRSDYDYNGRGSSAYAQDAQSAQGRAGATANYTTANDDYQNARGARVQEQDAIDKMRGAADGSVTSAAELQQQMGIAQSIQAQQAQAATARGGPGAWAAAQRGAQIQGANMAQNAVGQQSALRAAEQERARAALLQGTNQMRGTDLASRAQSAQQAQYDANLQQQQKAQNDAYSLGLSGLEQGAGRAQQAGSMGYSGDRVGSENAKAMADAQANEKNAMFGAGLASSALTSMSDERQKVGVAPVGINAQADDMGAQMNAMYGSPVAVQPTLDRDAALDPRMQAAKTFGADLDATYGAPTGVTAALARDAGLSPYASLQNIDTSKVAAGTQSALDRDAKALADKKAKAAATSGAAKKDEKDDPFSMGQRLGSSFGGFVGSLSDERQKTSVHGSAPAQMLEHLEPYAYHYKPESGEDPLKQRYGVMAQDLEQSPMGASVVVDTPRGKQIDVPAATGASLAALADLHERLKRVEGKGKR